MCDVRKDFELIHKIKGAKGSIRDIKIERDCVAVVGMDRFLRVFDYTTNEKISSVYLKHITNKVLFDGSTMDDVFKEEEKEKVVEAQAPVKTEDSKPTKLGKRKRKDSGLDSFGLMDDAKNKKLYE